MATPITIAQSPQTPFSFAYGPNPIVLDGLSINYDKYVLKVYRFGSNVAIADVRQAPNTNGMAIFDLRNIIQSQVGPIESEIESTLNGLGTERLRTAGPEHLRYQVEIGYQIGNQAPVMNSNSSGIIKYGPYLVYAGAKFESEVTSFEGINYQTQIIGDDSNPPCTEIGASRNYARPFTDQYYSINGDETGDTFSTVYSYTDPIVQHWKYDGDWMATTWFNQLGIGNPAPPIQAKGIEAFDVVFYNGATLISTSTVPNIVSYGGGPNIAIGDGTAPDGPYSTITVASGPGNILTGSKPVNWTHYYIVPLAYTPCPEGQQQLNVTSFPVAMPIRVNKKEPQCNDFTPTEVSWINSDGYLDTFTFTKRWERTINQNNNTYLKEYADYASTSYDVNSYDAGSTVYSQSMKQIYTIQSDFVNDEEAYLLRSLFRSPQVKVQLSGGRWSAAKLINTSYVEKTHRKDKLFQYTIQFEIPGIAYNMRG